jgi:hypothetical protein
MGARQAHDLAADQLDPRQRLGQRHRLGQGRLGRAARGLGANVRMQDQRPRLPRAALSTQF